MQCGGSSSSSIMVVVFGLAGDFAGRMAEMMMAIDGSMRQWA